MSVPPPPSLSVDTDDPTPPYEQLRRQLERAVRSGAVPAGHRLPPIRRLARDLGLAAGTVARTYRELEQAGLVSAARGGGTRVRDGLATPTPARRRADLDALATRFVAEARLLGTDDEAASAAVVRALGRSRAPGAGAGPAQ